MSADIPPDVVALFERRCAERGLAAGDLLGGGFALRQEGGRWIAARDYLHADGRSAERHFVLDLPRGENWRWARGAEARGSILVLGDPQRASLAVVAEGESDALRAWRLV